MSPSQNVLDLQNVQTSLNLVIVFYSMKKLTWIKVLPNDGHERILMLPKRDTHST